MRAKEFIVEAFDQPYSTDIEKSESGSYDVLAKLPDGSNLSIMFNNEGDDEWQVEFYRSNSQAVTGEGDAQRIFATVLNAIQQFIKEHQPKRLTFSASKEVDPGQSTQSRSKLYDRLVQRYAKSAGYRAFRAETGTLVVYELSRLKQGVSEAWDEIEGETPSEFTIKMKPEPKNSKAWIEKVYELYPSTFQGNHVMTWGEGEDQQFAMFELIPSFSRRGAVEVKWFQAYPLRAGVGSRAMKELQRLAQEDGIILTLYPWDKGQVSQAKLMKFYKGQGFKPNTKGSKNMSWEPAAKELTELFEPATALPLEWERMPGTRLRADHTPKDALYATAYDNDGRTITISFVPMPDGIVGIAFDRAGSMDITGKGEAVQIFATVVTAINKYIKAEKPLWISFSASEPSRAKLYQHMVKRLSGAYELLSPDQYPADEDLEMAQLGVGTFFLLRRK